METKNSIFTRYRNRIIFPALGLVRRATTKRAVRVEEYILPAKSRKKERVSERIRNILYK